MVREVLSFDSFEHHWTSDGLFTFLARRWSIDDLLAFKEEFIGVALIAILIISVRRSGASIRRSGATSEALSTDKVMTRLLVHLLEHLLLVKLMSMGVAALATSRGLHILVVRNTLSTLNKISLVTLHLDTAWQRNSCGTSRVVLVNLNTTEFAGNLTHDQAVVSLTEATSALRSTPNAHVVLVGHLINKIVQIIVALVVDIVIRRITMSRL